MPEQKLQPFELVVNGENISPKAVDIIASAPPAESFQKGLDEVAQLFEKEHRSHFFV